VSPAALQSRMTWGICTDGRLLYEMDVAMELTGHEPAVGFEPGDLLRFTIDHHPDGLRALDIHAA
jgi:hypothetical protein